MRHLARTLLPAAFALSLSSLWACSSGGGGGVFDPNADMTAPPDLASPPYPNGHFGNQQGDIFPNMTLAGYRLSTAQTDYTQLTWDKNIKLADYHADPKCKCLVVTVGALWCGACQQEQPKLVQEVMNDPAFCVLGIMQEGLSHSLATQSEVDQWVGKYQQDFFVVQGTNATRNLFNGYGQTVGLPFNLIVKTDTMEVQGVVQGYRPDIHNYAMGMCGGQ